jgi:hypothetical protein
VKAFDLMRHMQNLLPDAPPAFRAVIDNFLVESQEELFTSREACLAWAREHYAELVDGTKGGNLLSKYSMLGRFYATMPALEFLHRGIVTAVTQRGLAFDSEQLDTVMSYLRAVILHVPFADTMAKHVQWTSRHDLPQWAENRFAKPLHEYRLDTSRTVIVRLTVLYGTPRTQFGAAGLSPTAP